MGVLTDDQIRASAGVATPTDWLVTQGGIVTMRPLLVHSSSNAAVALPRRVIHIEYAASRQIAEGLELAVA